MASLEDEIKVLKEKNNDLVQKVQYWKMTAAQRQNEKLELMKEINQLRLKLSRIRSGGTLQARKLEASLQATSQEALTHLVQASSAVARSIEMAKKYFQDRQDLEASSPRWSNISGTPTMERVHKVPPTIGGRTIQPVVCLSRTSLNLRNTSNSPSRVPTERAVHMLQENAARSPNQSRGPTERAVPMHMLQDVYIPLTRIDAAGLLNNDDSEMDANAMNDSDELLGLEDDNDVDEQAMEVSNDSSESESYNQSRRLDAVTEDVEPEDEPVPQRASIENPMEGPSWLLDVPHVRQRSLKRMNLEPDSTTESFEHHNGSQAESQAAANSEDQEGAPHAFTPTVRRRKRSSSPGRRHDSGRILKVLVAKMKLDGEASSPKRSTMSFNAPSPNGAANSGVIVVENQFDERNFAGGDPSQPLSNISRRDARRSCDSNTSLPRIPTESMRESIPMMPRDSTQVKQERMISYARDDSNDSRGSDSDASEVTSEQTRSRRPRKPVTYKEKKLNVKLRR